MEPTNRLQAMADFAAMVSIISFLLGALVLIVFLVMASNIGTIKNVIKAMHAEQINNSAALRKLAGIESQEDKSRKFDEA